MAKKKSKRRLEGQICPKKEDLSFNSSSIGKVGINIDTIEPKIFPLASSLLKVKEEGGFIQHWLSEIDENILNRINGDDTEQGLLVDVAMCGTIITFFRTNTALSGLVKEKSVNSDIHTLLFATLPLEALYRDGLVEIAGSLDTWDLSRIRSRLNSNLSKNEIDNISKAINIINQTKV